MAAALMVKTLDEIETMRSSGRIVAEAFRLVERMLAPGVSTLELNDAVEEYIRASDARPAFKGYPSSSPGVKPFPGVICASLNEEVVHGIPSAERKLKNGDIIAIDIGVEKDGFFGDAARTYAIGEVGRKARKLLQVGAEALAAAKSFMRPRVPLSRVSKAIQKCAESNRFSVVRRFVGHGIGRDMHEPPQVPNFVSRSFGEHKFILEVGVVLALEPMINAGGPEVDVLADDGWTAVTKDRSLSVHFEDTVAVGAEGPIVLTA